MILIPVKNLNGAKQRLAEILDQEARTALAQAMLHDVLATVAGWSHRPEVAIISSDFFAVELARQFDFQVIPDDENRGETDAVESATAVCQARGIESTLVIPADIPLVEPWELQEIQEAAPARGSVLVPAGDGSGTNAALRRPAALFPLVLGDNSFRPHVSVARASGRPCVLLSLPGVALDVDRPADLRQLACAPGETRAQRLARQWDLADLPFAANE